MLGIRWKEGVLTPVITNVATAVILFLGALLFTPVRTWVFPIEEVASYPLICAFEPVPETAGGDVIRIEVYVINTTDEPWTRDKLAANLKALTPAGDGQPSPDIILELNRPMAQIDQEKDDIDFNDSKGELWVAREGGKSVRVTVREIAARGILRGVVTVSGLPRIGAEIVRRGALGAVPFSAKKLEDYRKRCYTRR